MNLTISVIAKLSKYSFEFREALDIYREDLASSIIVKRLDEYEISVSARFINRYYFGGERTTQIIINEKT